MKINIQPAIDSAKSIDLITLAGNYTKLSRASGQREWQGACPKCGGNDRFHVKPSGYFCRQCKTLESNNGIWYDQIDFVRWMNGCGFVDAVKQLVGGDIGSVPAPTTAIVKHKEPHTGEWLAKAKVIATEAHKRLLAGEGAAYLTSRGINQATWEQFNLGFTEAALPGTWDGKKRIYAKQPAIAIPWYKGEEITGIRYRFLKVHDYTDVDGKSRQEKQSALYDSDFAGTLHGEQALAPRFEDLRTLVICEGELNAVSIWQVTHGWGFDVISLGSESSKLTQETITKANKFGRVLIWMDRPSISKQIASLIPNCYAVNSPIQNGKKQDANDMLRNGLLGGLLASLRFLASTSDSERREFLWNLRDASHLGLDKHTLQVMADYEKNISRST